MSGSKRASILAIAARQHGVVAVRQTTALGVGRNVLANWARRGEAVRVGHGIYRLAGFPDSWSARAAAASLAVEAHGAVSHFGAAKLLGLPAPRRRLANPELEVTYFRRERVARPPVTAHESNVLVREDVVRVDGVQVTGIAFTIGALAWRMHELSLVRLVDGAIAEGCVTATELARLSVRLWACPGVPKLREALDQHRPQIALTASERERRFFRILLGARIEPPEVNAPVTDQSGGRRYLDFLWRRLGVWAEFDSHRFHDGSVARRADGRRQNDLVVLDGRRMTPLRFDDRDLFDAPDLIVAKVAETLSFARAELAERICPPDVH